MVVGLYMTFFGAYFNFVIIFIVGIIAWLIIGMIIVFTVFSSFTNGATDVEMAIVIGVSGFLGIIWGILMYKFERIFQITLGN